MSIETRKFIPEQSPSPESGADLKELLNKYENDFHDLVEQHGIDSLEILRMLLDDIKSGSDREGARNTALEMAKELPDYDRGGQIFSEFLSDQHALVELEDGSMVIDLERVGSLKLKEHYSTFNRLYGAVGSRSLRYGLYSALRGRSGTTLEQHEHGEKAHKEILYIPDDAESAFDSEKIKQKDFAFALWEVAKGSHEKSYPTKKGEKLNGNSVELATIIYHPGYGDGYRDEETGVLMIKDPQSGEHRPITKDILRDYGFLGSHRDSGSKKSITITSSDYFHQAVPELLEHDLIRYSDFRAVSGANDSKRPGVRRVGSRGMVPINRVLHYVGREFEDRAEVVKVDESRGVIIQTDEGGRKHPTHTFNILRPTRDRKFKFGESEYAGKDQTQVVEFDEEQFFKKRSDETEEDYSTRVKSMRNLEVYLDFSQELYSKTGLNLEALPFDLAIHLSSYCQSNPDKKSEVFEFAKKFRTDGLRVFSSLELGFENGEKIMTISEHAPDVVADRIFQKYNEILASIDEVLELLELQGISTESPAVSREVVETLLKQANRLLSEFSRLAEGSDEKDIVLTSRLLLSKLERVKTEAIVFASTFKHAHELAPDISLEDIRSTVVEVRDAEDLTTAERSEMLRIFLENRQNYPDRVYEQTKKSFEHSLDKSGGEFSLLYNRGQLISFIRFEKLPNGNLHSGSFNVRSEARGSAIGTAMIRATMDEKSRLNNIEGEIFSGNPEAVAFWKKMGFEIQGEDEDWKGTGATFIKVIRKKSPKHEQLKEAA